ncbi:MAG TPA: hypothetical protein VEA37_02220 [Flavobacterium sp.]|nr:hypothetical protein [Flavobacterium sp.]
MNNPEYIPIDELALIVEATRLQLVENGMTLPYLNYQYGYIRELNATLIQMDSNNIDKEKRFPLVWAEQPFVISRGSSAAYFGEIDIWRVFIMDYEPVTSKAKQRVNGHFKTKIWPIYRELLRQVDLSVAFSTMGVERIAHTKQDIFWWGDEQKAILDVPVDCSIVTFRKLQIANNPNCTPVHNF